jgi:hypothetical protein
MFILLYILFKGSYKDLYGSFNLLKFKFNSTFHIYHSIGHEKYFITSRSLDENYS